MSGTVDFTKGKTSKLILGFFFPLLVTNMLQQLYTFADTAIVGKGLGDNSLAAVGNMSTLTFLIIGFSMGLSNGFSILIAQNFGEKNFKKLRRSLSASIQLALLIIALLTIFSMIFLKPIMIMLQTDSLIMDESLLYGRIIFGGLFATIAYNLSSGILRSLGDSKTPLKAIITSSILNIALDIIFIFGFKTGVEGAAIATVISQIGSSFICINKLRKIDFLKLSKEEIKLDPKMYGILLKNGIPMALMNSITAIGCMVIQYFVNGLGVAYTSAYSACSKYINLFMQPSNTAGYAMSAYASQNYGAKKFGRIKEGMKSCLAISFSAYIILSFVMIFFPSQLASVLLNGSQQIAIVAQYLPICGAFLIFVNCLFVVRSCVQGMGFPLIPMISGIAEMVLRISVIVLFIGSVGFRTTAYADCCAWIGALAINIFAFLKVYRRESQKARNIEDTDNENIEENECKAKVLKIKKI